MILGVPKAVVIGASGGIGIATTEALLREGYCVIPVYRFGVDLTEGDSVEKLQKILANNQPEVVVNCAGKFGDNDTDYDSMFNINVRSSWAIIDHYIKNNTKPTKIILVGSTAYDHGRKNYMLYSASKAAVHNLWEGAQDFFSDTEITIHIVHPARTRTKMVAPYNELLDYLEPKEVAETIVELSRCSESEMKILKLRNKDEQKNWTFGQGNSRQSSL